MVAHDTEWFQKALGMFSGLEPSHESFTLASRLMGILGSVVEAFVPTMVDVRQHAPQGGRVA
jgi:hypothetical protein